MSDQTADEMRRRIETLEASLAEAVLKLDDQARRLAVSRSARRDLEAKLIDCELAIESRDEAFARLEGNLADARAAIVQLEADAVGRRAADVVLRARTRRLMRLGRMLAEAVRRIDGRDMRIADLERAVDKRNGRIRDLERVLARFTVQDQARIDAECNRRYRERIEANVLVMVPDIRVDGQARLPVQEQARIVEDLGRAGPAATANNGQLLHRTLGCSSPTCQVCRGD